MRFYPDVLACHAEFGGDVADMQRRYDEQSPPMSDEMRGEAMLDRVADAIEAAMCPNREGPYGLYDYGEKAMKRHCVRDFRDLQSDDYGRFILCTDDSAEAKLLYEKLTRHHIASSALRALLAQAEQEVARDA